MLILGIDNSTEVLSAALVEDDRVLGEIFSYIPLRQLKNLVPNISSMLEKSEKKLDALDFIAVTTGPGSYTGLRLAMATAKTIAQLLNVKIIPVNTLDLLARNFLCEDVLICPVVDAFKGEIFTAFYEYDGKSIKLQKEYFAVKPSDFIDIINKNNKKVYLFGNALLKYGREFMEKIDPSLYNQLPGDFWYPRASKLCFVAKEKLDNAITFENAKIFYLRNTDAAKWDGNKG